MRHLMQVGMGVLDPSHSQKFKMGLAFKVMGGDFFERKWHGSRGGFNFPFYTIFGNKSHGGEELVCLTDGTMCPGIL